MPYYNRRQVLKTAGASLLMPGLAGAVDAPLRIAGQDVELQISPVSAHTFRLTALPIHEGRLATLPDIGTVVQASWGHPPRASAPSEPR
jgi:hypothetical protein